VSDITSQKAATRTAAFARRKVVHAAYSGDGATRNLLDFLAPHLAVPVSAYMPIRTEIDILPAMAEIARTCPVGVPVILGAGRALEFRRWQPDAAMRIGAFGAKIPQDGDLLVPRIVILPLLAYDAHGFRLGYGGGFYDRTLEGLRAAGPVLAVGFAYAAQQIDAVPVEPTDQRLDAIVTEKGAHVFGQS
jgi:5-formyltetrahydrofolate cyclo-ligase